MAGVRSELLAALKRPGVEKLIWMFVPTKDRNGRLLSQSTLLPYVEARMASVAGGVTTIFARGSWHGDHGQTITEEEHIVECYVAGGLSSQAVGHVRQGCPLCAS